MILKVNVSEKMKPRAPGIETVKSIHNQKTICIFVFNMVVFY